jgi:hypothetical protein
LISSQISKVYSRLMVQKRDTVVKTHHGSLQKIRSMHAKSRHKELTYRNRGSHGRVLRKIVLMLLKYAKLA